MTRFLAAVLGWIREAFTDNVGLKALSLAFAIGLFIYLHGEEDIQDRTVPVGVVMRLPPESSERELMTQIRPSIHVTLRGSARALDRLVQAGMPPVELDLRDGRTETIAFEASMFSLPPGVEVTIIDPPSIELEWQDIVTRSIAIQAAVTGKPAEGYVVKGEPEVEPKDAQVRGPVGVVEVLQFARLAPFDVSGLTEGVYRRPIAIDAPPNRLSYLGAKSATVTVTIARRVTEAKFNRLEVEVVGMPRATTNPRHVNVTVVGPPEVVRALRAEQVVPRADLSQMGIDLEARKHGSVTTAVTVDVANAEVETQPPTVTVRW
jgi:YbbR domain-containing protein